MSTIAWILVLIYLFGNGQWIEPLIGIALMVIFLSIGVWRARTPADDLADIAKELRRRRK